MSLSIEEVLSVLKPRLDTATLTTVARELNKIEEEVKEDKKTAPKGKTRLVCLIRGDDPALIRAAQAGVFVLGVPDDETTATYSGEGLINRINAAIALNNDSKPKRGRKRAKIDTYAQGFSILKSKTVKESGSTFSIKGKGFPVELVVLTKESPTP